MTNSSTKVSNLAELREAAQKMLGLSAEDLENILASAAVEKEVTATANAILLGGEHDGKTYKGLLQPEDSRDDEYKSVDAVRENIFQFAAFIMATVKITDPGQADGSQKRSRADRRRVSIPTPSGNLTVELRHDVD